MRLGPSRDRSTATVTSVSLVRRSNLARRAAPSIRAAIDGQVVSRGPLRSTRSPVMPSPRANSRSVSRSPTMKLRAASMG